MFTVIVPTDFSVNAQKAANYAMSLFDESADIHLVNAFQIPHSGATVMISLTEILEKDATELLESEKQRLLSEFIGSDDRVTTVARMGEPETVIRRYAKEVNADLVIMGTQGASGIKGMLIGSVASSVLESSVIPVMTVPAECDLGLPTKIAFAADEAALNQMQIPDKLADLANFYSAEIHVVNVVSAEKAKETGLSGDESGRSINLINGLSHVYHFVVDEDVEHGLEAFLKGHPINLLALVNRKHDLVSRLFNRSMTKRMMLHSKTPILAIPYFEDAN